MRDQGSKEESQRDPREVIELFYEVGRLDRRYAQRAGLSLDPGRGQARCLFALEATGPQGQRELARRLGVQPPSVAELVSKLERKGLVIRTPAEHDARAVRVALTDEGARQVRAMRREQAEAHLIMLDALSPAETNELARILGKMRAHYLAYLDGKEARR